MLRGRASAQADAARTWIDIDDDTRRKGGVFDGLGEFGFCEKREHGS